MDGKDRKAWDTVIRENDPAPGADDRVQHLLSAAQRLTAWFSISKRSFPWREERTPYHVLVSETMLQQTRIETVLRYYDRFMKAFPTLKDLALAPSDLVMKYWEGLGYYSRARNLKRTAEICAERYGGELPESFIELKRLPGIGDYSAGAVASLCHNEPVPAVDGNVLRVFARFFADGRDVRSQAVKKDAERVILAVLHAPQGISSSLFNEALMELGETLCLPKGAPQCGSCPLGKSCRAHACGREESLPYRSAGAARRVEEKTVWVFVCDKKAAIEKRPDTGLLHSLYGFPMTEKRLKGKNEAETYLRGCGILPAELRPLGPAKHVFSHREWHMEGWLAATRAPVPGLVYATAKELEDTYALPSAFRFYREAAEKALASSC